MHAKKKTTFSNSSKALLWKYNKSILSHGQFLSHNLKEYFRLSVWNPVYSKLFSRQHDSVTLCERCWETNDRAGPPVSSALTKQQTTQVGRARERERMWMKERGKQGPGTSISSLNSKPAASSISVTADKHVRELQWIRRFSVNYGVNYGLYVIFEHS